MEKLPTANANRRRDLRITKRKTQNTRSVFRTEAGLQPVDMKSMFLVKKKVSDHNLKYEGMHQGPILITAAHSTKLLRGVGIEGDFERIHWREEWVSYIVIRLAFHLNTIHNKKLLRRKKANRITATKIASFMIWNKDKKYDKDDIDPNYMSREMFPNSCFYKSVRKWLSSLPKEDVPFHIDIHGKKNRKKNRDINVGIKSMFKEWPFEDQKNEFSLVLRNATGEMINQVFSGVKGDFMTVRCSKEQELCGYWNGPMQTVTTQAVNLGIPSFQLEIPRSVRKTLAKNDRLMQSFADGIYQLYDKIVGKMWLDKGLYTNREPYFIDDVVNTYEKTTVSLLDQLSKEYYIWEKYAKDRVI